MTIYDRAREVLRQNSSRVIPKERTDFPAEVVRLHDEFAALADAMDREAYYLRFDCMEEEADYRQEAAARIREVIQGEQP